MASDGPEPISADEFLYRRVPVSTSWYDPFTHVLDSQAFAPHKTADVTGLSIHRSKYKTVEQAAQGRSGKSYYVAILRARDVVQADIDVVPRPNVPDGYDPAHAEFPQLNAANRKLDQTLEMQRLLASMVIAVEGPFETP